MTPNANPYTPGSGDAAIEMLREIFGTAITHIVGGSTAGAESATANMLGSAFGVFNGGVLFFGSLLLTWVTIFGLTNTANDGQVLGKKWSTFYTPLRTFTASAMLIPSTSGYSMVQLAILLIVTWSVGFASNMWSHVVDYVVDGTTTDQVMRSVIDDRQFDQIALNALGMEVCAYGLSKGVNDTTGSKLNLQLRVRNQKIATGSTSTTYNTTLDMRDPAWPGSEEVCGTMVLTSTFTKPDSNRSSVNQATATLGDEVAKLQANISNIRYKAAMDSFAKMAPQVQEMIRVSDTPGAVFSASRVQAVIDQARATMLQDVRNEVAKDVGAANTNLKARLTQGGWVMAGSMERELMAVKDAIRGAMKTQMQFSPGTYSPDHILGGSGAVSNAIQLTMIRYTSLAGFVMQKLDQGADTQTRNPTDMPKLRTGLRPDDFTDGGTTVKTQIQAYCNSLANWAMSGAVFWLGEDGTDPVMQVKDLGDWMATFGETVFVTKMLLVSVVDGLFEGSKAASNQTVLGTNMAALLSVGPGVLGFILTYIQETFSLLKPGLYSILYCGYFLGMWIPMVPFYVFSLGVIAWLVQVVESLAAGSLWMVMHLTPERDDSFIGSQQQGYLLLMSLFARPPLMVLGLVASMAILIPSVRYINAGYMAAFRSIQADSITGLLSLGGFMLIYCVIILGVFSLVFSLPQTLPDRILRWIGAGISDMGEQNTMSRIESGASGQARAAAGAAAAGMLSRDKDRKEREREARRANTPRDEQDSVRPEGHSK